MYLGGAPVSVATHLVSLFQRSVDKYHGEDEHAVQHTVAIVTCLGNDRLGEESVQLLAPFNVRTDYIQFHSTWEMSVAIGND